MDVKDLQRFLNEQKTGLNVTIFGKTLTEIQQALYFELVHDTKAIYLKGFRAGIYAATTALREIKDPVLPLNAFGEED